MKGPDAAAVAADLVAVRAGESREVTGFLRGKTPYMHFTQGTLIVSSGRALWRPYFRRSRPHVEFGSDTLVTRLPLHDPQPTGSRRDRRLLKPGGLYTPLQCERAVGVLQLCVPTPDVPLMLAAFARGSSGQ